MKLIDRVIEWRDEGILIAAACIALAMLEYDSFIRRRNDRR